MAIVMKVSLYLNGLDLDKVSMTLKAMSTCSRAEATFCISGQNQMILIFKNKTNLVANSSICDCPLDYTVNSVCIGETKKKLLTRTVQSQQGI